MSEKLTRFAKHSQLAYFPFQTNYSIGNTWRQSLFAILSLIRFAIQSASKGIMTKIVEGGWGGGWGRGGSTLVYLSQTFLWQKENRTFFNHDEFAFNYTLFHKTLPKFILQMHWISVIFYEMDDSRCTGFTKKWEGGVRKYTFFSCSLIQR